MKFSSDNRYRSGLPRKSHPRGGYWVLLPVEFGRASTPFAETPLDYEERLRMLVRAEGWGRV